MIKYKILKKVLASIVGIYAYSYKSWKNAEFNEQILLHDF